MELEEFVKKSTPNLTSDKLHTVLQLLAYVGVESVDDLAFVQEKDLLNVLPPIKARKLIQNWSCNG